MATLLRSRLSCVHTFVHVMSSPASTTDNHNNDGNTSNQQTTTDTWHLSRSADYAFAINNQSCELRVFHSGCSILQWNSDCCLRANQNSTLQRFSFNSWSFRIEDCVIKNKWMKIACFALLPLLLFIYAVQNGRKVLSAIGAFIWSSAVSR